MQLFFNQSLTHEHQSLVLDQVESRHVVRVLRKKIGDEIFITNGKGTLFTGEIIDESEKKCELLIVKTEEQSKHPYYIHIAIAPTKNNDRFEWFLEKATEIGIDEITPIICDNSERKILKLARMNRIIETALKQSLTFHLPILNEPISFKNFIAKNHTEKKFLAHCEKGDKVNFKDALLAHEDSLVMIGPEGDFSKNEISLAENAEFAAISLGPQRLRTETAGMVAVHTVALLNQ